MSRKSRKQYSAQEKVAIPRETRQEERSDFGTDGGERPVKKSQWGTLQGGWVPHDIREPRH